MSGSLPRVRLPMPPDALAGNAMGIKLQDLSKAERVRVETAIRERGGVHVVSGGKVYELMGVVQGKVVTRYLNGEDGPRLSQKEVELLERDEDDDKPGKKTKK